MKSGAPIKTKKSTLRNVALLSASLIATTPLAKANANQDGRNSQISQQSSKFGVTTDFAVTYAACLAAPQDGVGSYALCAALLRTTAERYPDAAKYSELAQKMQIAGAAVGTSDVPHTAWIADGVVHTGDIVPNMAPASTARRGYFRNHFSRRNRSAIEHATLNTVLPSSGKDSSSTLTSASVNGQAGPTYTLSDATLVSLGLSSPLPNPFDASSYKLNDSTPIEPILVTARTRALAPRTDLNGKGHPAINHGNSIHSTITAFVTSHKISKLLVTGFAVLCSVSLLGMIESKRKQAIIQGVAAAATYVAIKAVSAQFVSAATNATMAFAVGSSALAIAGVAAATAAVGVAFRSRMPVSTGVSKKFSSRKIKAHSTRGALGGVLAVGLTSLMMIPFSGPTHFAPVSATVSSHTAVVAPVKIERHLPVSLKQTGPDRIVTPLAVSDLATNVVPAPVAAPPKAQMPAQASLLAAPSVDLHGMTAENAKKFDETVATLSRLTSDQGRLDQFKEYSFYMLRSSDKNVVNIGYNLLKQGVAFAQSHHIDTPVVARLQRDLKVEDLIRAHKVPAAAVYWKAANGPT